MRTLSPIRSLSPGPKPKIVFNYQPSPLRERPTTTLNGTTTPNGRYLPVANNIMVSPNNIRTNSFLTNQGEKENGNIQPRCAACPKQATYRAAKQSKVYCSSCAIEIMKRGMQVVRIQLKDQKFYKEYHENQQQNQINVFSPKVKEFVEPKPTIPIKQRQTEITELISNIDQEQTSLQHLLQKLNSEHLTTEGIRGIYHEKKLSLKRHYEKIKAAIKLSIQKDLEELDRRERSSLKCVQDKRMELQENIFMLKQIKQEVQPKRTDLIHNFDESDYQKILKQHREETKTILQNKEVSIHLINELTSHQLKAHLTESEIVKQTQEQLATSRISQLYDPYTYTMIDTRQKKGETLFSFEGKMETQ